MPRIGAEPPRPSPGTPAAAPGSVAVAPDRPAVGEAFGSVTVPKAPADRPTPPAGRSPKGKAATDATTSPTGGKRSAQKAVPRRPEGAAGVDRPTPVPVPRWSAVEPAATPWSPVPATSEPSADGDATAATESRRATRHGDQHDADHDDVAGEAEEPKPHPYTWVHVLVLVLVAFVLGMLIFMVVMNEPTAGDNDAGAAIVHALPDDPIDTTGD